MRTLRAVLARLAGSWPSGRRERDLAEELESHLQMHVDDNVRAGMPLDEARREAVLKLGGVEATKEAYRERAGLPFVEHSWQDLRFAVRQLSRNPAFAADRGGRARPRHRGERRASSRSSTPPSSGRSPTGTRPGSSA